MFWNETIDQTRHNGNAATVIVAVVQSGRNDVNFDAIETL